MELQQQQQEQQQQQQLQDLKSALSCMQHLKKLELLRCWVPVDVLGQLTGLTAVTLHTVELDPHWYTGACLSRVQFPSVKNVLLSMGISSALEFLAATHMPALEDLRLAHQLTSNSGRHSCSTTSWGRCSYVTQLC
jgi:hypothetical protein